MEDKILENWMSGKLDYYNDEEGEVFDIAEKPKIIPQSLNNSVLLSSGPKGYSDCWDAITMAAKQLGVGNDNENFDTWLSYHLNYNHSWKDRNNPLDSGYYKGYLEALDHFLNSGNEAEKSVAEKIKRLI